MHFRLFFCLLISFSTVACRRLPVGIVRGARSGRAKLDINGLFGGLQWWTNALAVAELFLSFHSCGRLLTKKVYCQKGLCAKKANAPRRLTPKRHSSII